MDPEISLPCLQERVRISNLSRTMYNAGCITHVFELASYLRLGVPSVSFN
jgi:hypothetical protein